MKVYRLCFASVILLASLYLGQAEVVGKSPILNSILHSTSDFLNDRFPRQPLTNTPVVIVDIDESSLQEYGQWPWPRDLLATLVTKLHQAEVAVVAFDMFFPEADRLSVARGNNVLSNDQLFAQAIRLSPVVLGASTQEDVSRRLWVPKRNRGIEFEQRRDRTLLYQYKNAVANIDLLNQAARSIGLVTMTVDEDGIVRQTPLLFKINRRTVPAFSLEAIRIGLGKKLIVHSGPKGIAGLSIGDLQIPTDRHGRIRFYDSGSLKSRFISAKLILSGENKLALDQAIVFVGISAEGLKDIRTTALSPAIAGVEVHAQLAEQILAHQYIQLLPFSNRWQPLYLLIFGMLFLLAIAFEWRKFLSWMISLTGIILIPVIVILAYRNYHILLHFEMALLGLTVMTLIDRFIRYIEVKREKHFVQSAFNHYVPSNLLDTIYKNRDALQLGGSRKELTVLFADVRGFTGFSEVYKEHPVELAKLINKLLTPLTKAIHRYRGTVDKYMGDCVMAFWNAPIDVPNHAKQACLAALAIQQAMKVVNAKLKGTEAQKKAGTLSIGVGLNTGMCFVGNMGSNQRFDYSAIGDTVNLASRLEGQCRTYEVGILIGEKTASLVVDELALLELDRIRVKGKKESVSVFVLLGGQDLKMSEGFIMLTKLHKKFLEAYRQQHWDDLAAKQRTMAANFLANRLELNMYYAIMLARARDFKAAQLGVHWDGIYTATSK